MAIWKFGQPKFGNLAEPNYGYNLALATWHHPPYGPSVTNHRRGAVQCICPLRVSVSRPRSMRSAHAEDSRYSSAFFPYPIFLYIVDPIRGSLKINRQAADRRLSTSLSESSSNEAEVHTLQCFQSVTTRRACEFRRIKTLACHCTCVPLPGQVGAHPVPVQDPGLPLQRK